jgi:hypothetical protein
MSASQHVANESRVPWHVDDPDLCSAWESHVRESKIDCHAASLFLSQAVRVDPGERGHQGGLAVVDVARRTDDEAHLATFL